MESQHQAYRGKNPTLLINLYNIIIGKQVIKEDNWRKHQKGVYIGIKVTSRYPSHLYEEKGWGTIYVCKLLTAKYYYYKELLFLTPDYWVARINIRSMLLYEAKPMGYL